MLPIKIDIIKHSREIDGKSTAVHAAVLAPDDVNIYTYPCIPDYGSNEKVVLVFPGKDAVSVENIFDSLSEMDADNAEPRPKKLNVGARLPITKAVFIDSTWNQSRGIYKDQRVRDLPCIVLQSRISQFWRHQNGSPRWYLATIEAIHQFLVELHTVAWNMNSVNLCAESSEMKATGNGQKTQERSTCVETSKNIDTTDRDANAADRISHLSGTSNGNVTGEQSSNPDWLRNEHKKISDASECFGPYRGEYDNLLFFFCYMYNKIHKLYDHEDLRAYKRPLK
ncbi:DTW domain-containing protein 1 isoform X3 [Zootermopsis nevadensis]|uniref:DTW domain-containing protein 1 isoform X3 n=1 Tax=Zootermopsis nevadensis TaxID=136037 RepID=UPI000B8E37C0|nr:DTW domain-containing protein 1 isoform X3 [Zootermopsis nevadensis]